MSNIGFFNPAVPGSGSAIGSTARTAGPRAQPNGGMDVTNESMPSDYSSGVANGTEVSVSDEALRRLNGATSAVGNAWDEAVEGVGSAVKGIGDYARDAYHAVENTVTGTASSIAKEVSAAEDTVTSAASTFGHAVSDIASEANSAIGGLGGYVSLAIAIAK